MLFNSYPFILFFLPLTLASFGFARRLGYRSLSISLLLLASLIFYGYGRPDHLVLFVGTVFGTYVVGRVAARRGRWAKLLTVVGVVANLSNLILFKYTGWLLETSGLSSGLGWVLPIGISFYTFQQVAYLIDCYKTGEAEESLVEYALFVSFFPQLIAGPIVHHSTTRPQFDALRLGPIDLRLPTMGATIFVVGMAKKVLVADNLASYANPIFDAADHGAWPDMVTAWSGAFLYTLQIYFDFSGYSDIAIGLGLLFGVRLPKNFDSPYQATGMIDFWRCWHITLSTWLRDYIYIPLGGNRLGEGKRLRNIFITMLIGGIWHGAGWTFVIWGFIHASFITANHWLRGKRPPSPEPSSTGVLWAKRLGTLLIVLVAWVFFRATTVSGAGRILGGMLGAGVEGSRGLLDVTAYPWMVFGAVVTLLLPNTLDYLGYAEWSKGPRPPESPAAMRSYHPSLAMSVGAGLLFSLVLASIWRPTVFIYFNF